MRSLRAFVSILCMAVIYVSVHNQKSSSRTITNAVTSFVRNGATKASVSTSPPKKHTAIAMRTMMPIKPTVLSRMVQIMRLLHSNQSSFENSDCRFQHYDFVVLVDETQMDNAHGYIQHYFDRLANVPMPYVYGTTETAMRNDLQPGIDKYINGPLLNGETNQSKLMWQMLGPTFVSFVKNFHKTYRQTWVFEDDVWALGKGSVPLLDMIYEWDVAIARDYPHHSGLAAIATRANGCPYYQWVKGKHTPPFQEILEEMYQTNNFTLWKEYAVHPQRLAKWTETKSHREPQIWSCVTDSIYRHTRDFSLYYHRQIKDKGIYRFAEGYHQPLAWKGKFDIVDLEKIAPRDPEHGFWGYNQLSGADESVKITIDQARRKSLGSDAGKTFIFHNFLPNVEQAEIEVLKSNEEFAKEKKESNTNDKTKEREESNKKGKTKETGESNTKDPLPLSIAQTATARIPRNLHIIHLSPGLPLDNNTIPERVQRTVYNWQIIHPKWKIMLWTNSKFHQEFPGLYTTVQPLKVMAQTADLLRYHALEKYGGVYVDTDIVPIRSIDPLMAMLPQTAFGVCEAPREPKFPSGNPVSSISELIQEGKCQFLCNAVIGAVPHHAALRSVIGDAVEVTKRRIANGQLDYNNFATGPPRWSIHVNSRNNTDITTLKAHTFFPCNWDNTSQCQLKKFESNPNIYAMHEWKRSWW